MERSRQALHLDDVSLSFGGLHAIRNLSFEVSPGTICGLIGPNGAGKTSVLNVISRFYQPSEGRVKYGEVDLLRLHAYQVINCGVARSFQNVALFKNLRVFDNLLLGADHLKRAGVLRNMFRFPVARTHERLARERAEQVMNFLELADLRNRLAGELSFGHQKLVDLGRALVANPSFLLLDEPAAGMQDSQKVWLEEVIRRIPDEYEATVLLIEHDMSLVLGVSSRVIVMDHGAKIAEGTPDEVRTNPRVITAYLGTGDV